MAGLNLKNGGYTLLCSTYFFSWRLLIKERSFCPINKQRFDPWGADKILPLYNDNDMIYTFFHLKNALNERDRKEKKCSKSDREL